MDKYERRRLRLLELRDTRCRRSVAELARKIARDASYVSRMLYVEGKPGKKRIADDMMEVIETAFRLERGWLDRDLREDVPPEVVRVGGGVKPDQQAQELLDLLQMLCPEQRGEVLGYARRVAESGTKATKANAVK